VKEKQSELLIRGIYKYSLNYDFIMIKMINKIKNNVSSLRDFYLDRR